MSERKFYQHVFRVVVLSEDANYEPAGIYNLAFDITDGDYIGMLEGVRTNELTREQVVDELYLLGSEPAWFELDEFGDDLDDESTDGLPVRL